MYLKDSKSCSSTSFLRFASVHSVTILECICLDFVDEWLFTATFTYFVVYVLSRPSTFVFRNEQFKQYPSADLDFDFCENRGKKRVQEAVYLGA